MRAGGRRLAHAVVCFVGRVGRDFDHNGLLQLLKQGSGLALRERRDGRRVGVRAARGLLCTRWGLRGPTATLGILSWGRGFVCCRRMRIREVSWTPNFAGDGQRSHGVRHRAVACRFGGCPVIVGVQIDCSLAAVRETAPRTLPVGAGARAIWARPAQNRRNARRAA